MSPEQKKQILETIDKCVQEKFLKKHVANIKKLKKLKEFKYNPFLYKYLAKLACGDDSYVSIARALIYPRVLATSVNTIFGNSMQFICTEILNILGTGEGSTSSGIDIEFYDQLEKKRRIFCQLKSGPSCINNDDVAPISKKFENLINLAKANHRTIHHSDCVVGVVYGTKEHLNAAFKKLDTSSMQYVYVGKEFWWHLTGVEDFYDELTRRFVQQLDMTSNGKELLEETIKSLAEDIKTSLQNEKF